MPANLDLVEKLRHRLPNLAEGELLDLANRASDELERRVGEVLSAGLTDAQLEEFEALIDSGDDAAAARWLHANRPGYQHVAAEELGNIIDEVVSAVSGTNRPEVSSAPPPAASPEPDQANDARDTTALIRNWDELRHVLHTAFTCRPGEDDELSIILDLPDDRSQLVIVSHINDKWAEVHTAVGAALGPDEVSTALKSLGAYIGVGAVVRNEVLIARHGLPYEGLTSASAQRAVSLVAIAGDKAEQDSTGQDQY